jgi:hypothetical protein
MLGGFGFMIHIAFHNNNGNIFSTSGDASKTKWIAEKQGGEFMYRCIKKHVDSFSPGNSRLRVKTKKEMAKINIESRDEKELQKRLKKKIGKAVEAKKVYEKVILFKRPDWAIASLYRIGSNMEELANTIRDSKCPKRLNYDQCEIYKGILEDNAKKIEDDAVSFYIKSLETSRSANWFNQYTKLSEVRLARLRPKEYRKPSELRAEPNHIQPGFSSVEFITKMKDEDRLADIGKTDEVEPQESDSTENDEATE